jgi:hypothetical protein
VRGRLAGSRYSHSHVLKAVPRSVLVKLETIGAETRMVLVGSKWRGGELLLLEIAKARSTSGHESGCLDVTLRSNEHLPQPTTGSTHIMALVNYSDSEGSDIEAPIAAPAPKVAASAKPKLINRTESKKIKVELPQIRPEPGQGDADQPAPKRAKTAGAFSGFNSFLPPPKKTGQNAPKPGVSLKTSSEAAFSRTPVPVLPRGDEGDDLDGSGKQSLPVAEEKREEEPKIVGKPTRFMPLSVANARKKKKPIHGPKVPVSEKSLASSVGAATQESSQGMTQAEAPPKAKAKVSLFSFGGEETITPTEKHSASYQPEFADPEAISVEDTTTTQTQQASLPPSTNTLSDIASDMNLTPAQRRQLFGRGGMNAGNIAHFNMDAEYRSNQELAASGETFEHKQVKTIAPGKHSLQQLVNNVKSQSSALEDKWAEGRRNRGEGGSKYGF